MSQRILIVDPDPRVRRGLRALLETQPDMEVVGEAGTAADALRHFVTLHPSMVLLDLALPTIPEGLATIRRLAAKHCRCIAVSWRNDLREAAMEMGALAFIEKGSQPERLFASIRGDPAGASLGVQYRA